MSPRHNFRATLHFSCHTICLRVARSTISGTAAYYSTSLALSIAERETEQFPRLFAAGHVLFSAAVWLSSSLAASLCSCPVCECMLFRRARSLSLSLRLVSLISGVFSSAGSLLPLTFSSPLKPLLPSKFIVGDSI